MHLSLSFHWSNQTNTRSSENKNKYWKCSNVRSGAAKNNQTNKIRLFLHLLLQRKKLRLEKNAQNCISFCHILLCDDFVYRLVSTLSLHSSSFSFFFLVLWRIFLSLISHIEATPKQTNRKRLFSSIFVDSKHWNGRGEQDLRQMKQKPIQTADWKQSTMEILCVNWKKPVKLLLLVQHSKYNSVFFFVFIARLASATILLIRFVLSIEFSSVAPLLAILVLCK